MVATVRDVRRSFAKAYANWHQAGRPDIPTLEIIGASFHANEPTIFGKENPEYVRKELAWYDSQSRNVNDLEDTPAIWKQVASPDGYINSNYGYLLYSGANGSQYHNVLEALKKDFNTRQAIAIYTNPNMHVQSTDLGMHDFVCTNTVQYFIRGQQLQTVVQMRSNDAVFGYKNDYAWQREVQLRLASDLQETYPGLARGEIMWQVGSLHVYPRHFDLVLDFIKSDNHG